METGDNQSENEKVENLEFHYSQLEDLLMKMNTEKTDVTLKAHKTKMKKSFFLSGGCTSALWQDDGEIQSADHIIIRYASQTK